METIKEKIDEIKYILKKEEIEFIIDNDGDMIVEGRIPQDIDIIICDIFAEDIRFENSEFRASLNSTFFATEDEYVEMTRTYEQKTAILFSNLRLQGNGGRRQRLSPKFFEDTNTTAEDTDTAYEETEEETNTFDNYKNLVSYAKSSYNQHGYGIDILRGNSSRDEVPYQVYSFTPEGVREYETTLYWVRVGERLS